MFSSNFFPQHNQNQEAIEEKPSADEAGRILRAKLTSETKTRQAPRELTEPEKRSGAKRCKRCSCKYTELTNTECFYHPGSYERVSARMGTRVGWSCCRAIVVVDANTTAGLNQLAPLEERAAFHAKGCKRANRHIEDEIYTRTILNFPFKHGAEEAYEEKMRLQREEEARINAAKLQSSSTKANVPPSKESIVSTKFAGGSDDDNDSNDAQVQVEYWRHTVSPFDTLPGLALRYDVSIDEIRRLNGVHGSELFGKRELLIPISEDVGRQLAPPVDPKRLKEFQIGAFKRQTGTCDEEARYYFAESNDDLKAALALRERDLEFERNHKNGNKPKGTLLNRDNVQ